MRSELWRLIATCLCLGLFCIGLTAQNDTLTAAAGGKYVISAKAGGVNLVQGAVTVARTNGRTGVLVKGDDLNIGDRVSTGSDGKAEILLNPGSFLRVGGNSAFEFKQHPSTIFK